MLEGIDTGYEAKFDFPAREGPPPRPYLFASVPRSGSTYVSHLLWRTGCLGAPLEYLNFEPTGPYGFAHEAPARQHDLWQSALGRRTSPNGIFGLKAFPEQLEQVHRQNPRLMVEVMRLMLGRGPGSKVVQLRRRDRTAHAISMARAMLSGIWRKEQEGEDRPEPEYSELAVTRTAALIEQQERGWAEMYQGLGILPLVVFYEDVLADPPGFVAAVAGYLGVELDSSAEVVIPEIERQSQKGAQAWAAAHSKT
jgi:LPS sulfotransferase NodH